MREMQNVSLSSVFWYLFAVINRFDIYFIVVIVSEKDRQGGDI